MILPACRPFLHLALGRTRCFTLSRNRTFAPSPLTTRSMSSQFKTPLTFPDSGFEVIDTSEIIEEEMLPTYKPEKYYPARIGQVLEERYQIVGKVGYGGSSTVWLARDFQYVYPSLPYRRCSMESQVIFHGLTFSFVGSQGTSY